MSPENILKNYFVGKRLVSLEFHDPEIEYYEDIGIDPPAIGEIITHVSLGCDSDRDPIMLLHFSSGKVNSAYDNENVIVEEVV